MYPPIPSDLIGELQFNDDRWVNVLAARRGGGGWGGEWLLLITAYAGRLSLKGILLPGV